MVSPVGVRVLSAQGPQRSDPGAGWFGADMPPTAPHRQGNPRALPRVVTCVSPAGGVKIRLPAPVLLVHPEVLPAADYGVPEHMKGKPHQGF